MRKSMAADFMTLIVESANLLAIDHASMRFRAAERAARDIERAADAVILKNSSAVAIGRVRYIVEGEADEWCRIAHGERLRPVMPGGPPQNTAAQLRKHHLPHEAR